MVSQLTSTPNSDEQALQVATKWLAALGSAKTAETFASLFLPTGWLRDLLCFSWDFKSLAGRERIVQFLSAPSELGGKTRFEHTQLHNFEFDKSILPAKFPVPGNPQLEGVSTAFTFAITSPPATGRGLVRLLPDGEGGEWRAFTVLTNIENLNGHEEPKEGIEGYFGTTWEEEHARKMAEIESDPTVLIVGGGLCGLMCAARFGRMGIRALVIEQTARVGDVWRNRYPNLSLHLPAYPMSVLYQSWPKTYPKYLPRDKIADLLESYAVGQELNVWLSSTILPTPRYDASTGRWQVEINHAGNRVYLKPKHIVFATGLGAPKVPSWPGMDTFAGKIYHSDHQKSAVNDSVERVSKCLNTPTHSTLVLEGKIKIKQGVQVARVEPEGLVFADGSKLAADVIVLATGYHPIMPSTTSIMGSEIQNLIGNKIWGLDEGGELIHSDGGAWILGCTRRIPAGTVFEQTFSAIQIKAEELGLKKRI